MYMRYIIMVYTKVNIIHEMLEAAIDNNLEVNINTYTCDRTVDNTALCMCALIDSFSAVTNRNIQVKVTHYIANWFKIQIKYYLDILQPC